MQVRSVDLSSLIKTHKFRSENYKRGVQLQKSLLPNSDVHHCGHIQELWKLVSDLKGMAEELNLEPEDSEEHLLEPCMFLCFILCFVYISRVVCLRFSSLLMISHASDV